MNELLLFLLGLFFMPYLMVPILIRRNHSFSLTPSMRPVLTGFLPPGISRNFEGVESSLQPLGFEPRVDAVSLDYGPNLRVFFRIFVAKEKPVVAISTSLLSDGNKKPVKNFLEFLTRLPSGRELSTHNSDLAAAPIDPPHKVSWVLPDVSDAKVLYSLHVAQAHKHGFGDADQALMPSQGEEISFLVKGVRDDLSRQVDLGCLLIDEDDHCYRPTWAGAFLMGWYSMWPIVFIRRRWQKIRARLALKNLDGLRPC